MGYFVVSLIGFLSGGTLVFFLLENKRKNIALQYAQLQSDDKKLHVRQLDVAGREQQYSQAQQAYLIAKENFDKQVITYGELAQENVGLKMDLSSLHQQLRKHVLDYNQSSQQQAIIDNKVSELGVKYLRDQTKWIMTDLTQGLWARAGDSRMLSQGDPRCHDDGSHASSRCPRPSW